MTRRRIALLLAAMPLISAISLVVPRPAAAFIVFDPSNYASNVLQAARSLQQIVNQVSQLQNEAQMLIGQARNLASLPYSALAQLQGSVQRTQALLQQAQQLAYQVTDIDAAFRSGRYGAAQQGQTGTQLFGNAQSRWQTSVAALEDALKVQAGVVGNLDTNRTQLGALVGSSQGAVGALQATQAGNQLLALQAQQLADLTAAVAAEGRAQALDAAQRASAADQAREQLRRFLVPGSGYQPTAITMFHN